MKDHPFFSLTEIQTVEKTYLAPIETVTSSDDVVLAFREYLPESPKAVLIFYHGAGAHSGLTYNHIGAGLSDEYDIAVYMPDLRGHGQSGGARGDSPSPRQALEDIKTFISHAQSKYPDLPVFLAGHSGGGGLILNYSGWSNMIPVDGYVFISPYFGYRSKTEYDIKKVDFSTVKVSRFVINSMSAGLLMGHSRAVLYRFPQNILEGHPRVVPFNTVNMANALTPTSPKTQFNDLEKFGLWVGENDEAFDPSKIIKFAKKNSHSDAHSNIQVVNGENHFSILLKTHELIGPWLLSQI